MKIVCLSTESKWSKKELERLGKLGEFIQIKTPPKNESEAVNLLRGAKYAVVAPLSFGAFSKKILESVPDLKGISIVTTRFAWIDIQAAKKMGILICNLPGYSTISVSELALGVLLDVSRKITPAALSATRGNRTFEGYKGFELKGKTLGIIGCGSIGSYIGNLGKGLGMEVVGWNRTPKKTAIKLVPLEKLLKESDVISVNLAINEETKGFLNAQKLSLLKPSAIVINYSPEGLIDQDYIYGMLSSSKLRGYGFELDEGKTYPTQEKLLRLPNVVATPHIGWFTSEAEQRVKDMTIENLEAMVRGTPINNVA